MRTRALALLALLLVVPGCGGSSGDRSETAGRVVFLRSADAEETGDLVVRDVRAGRMERIAQDVRSPSVSADGSALLFSRGGDWWLRSGGSEARRLEVQPEDDDLVLSPDGRSIFFTRVVRGERGYAVAIFAMRRDGTGVRQVTRPLVWANGTCDEDPGPLPDGGLAYTRYADCTRRAEPSIEVVARDGRQVAVLGRFDEHGEFRLSDPALSPDGDWISFAAARIRPGLGAGRYVAAADGTHAHLIGVGGSAAWSPNSHRLAFADGGDVWIIRRDGSGLRRVTKTPAREDVVAWLATAAP